MPACPDGPIFPPPLLRIEERRCSDRYRAGPSLARLWPCSCPRLRPIFPRRSTWRRSRTRRSSGFRSISGSTRSTRPATRHWAPRSLRRSSRRRASSTRRRSLRRAGATSGLVSKVETNRASCSSTTWTWCRRTSGSGRSIRSPGNSGTDTSTGEAPSIRRRAASCTWRLFWRCTAPGLRSTATSSSWLRPTKRPADFSGQGGSWRTVPSSSRTSASC